MNDQEFRSKMEEKCGVDPKRRSRGRILTGLFLFFVGVLLLFKTANWIWFPAWFFTWPMLFIAFGIVSGLKHGFRGGGWVVLLIIGGLFLSNEIDPTLHLDRYAWPIVLIAIGIAFILRPGRDHRWRRWRYDNYNEPWQRTSDTSASTDNSSSVPGSYDGRDYVDITAVFGGVKKNILSKKFKGGDITSFMGGSEINLSQADFTGTIKLDVTNIFGGTKLILPSTWEVQNDITAVLGGVDDKRLVTGVTTDPEKLLILDGVCVFGGIEIRSF